jgi:hypothetical protein
MFSGKGVNNCELGESCHYLLRVTAVNYGKIACRMFPFGPRNPHLILGLNIPAALWKRMKN